MSMIRLNSFTHFQLPIQQKFWSGQSLAYLITNITNFGIKDAAKAVRDLSRIEYLKLKQQDLLKQARELNQACEKLEERFHHALRKFKTLDLTQDEQKEKFQRKITRLNNEQEQFNEKDIKANLYLSPTFIDAVRTLMILVGHLIANALTIGLYGTYQKCVLENRLAVLKAQNKHIQKELRAWQNTQSDNFRNQTDLLLDQFQYSTHNPLQANPQELDSLNQQIDDLTQQIEGLQVKCQTAEQAYQALKVHQKAVQDQQNVQVQPQVNQKIEDHQQLIDAYKKQNEAISQELVKTRQEREAARQERNAAWDQRKAAYQESRATFQKLTEARNERHKAEQEKNAKIQELNQLRQQLATTIESLNQVRTGSTADKQLRDTLQNDLNAARQERNAAWQERNAAWEQRGAAYQEKNEKTLELHKVREQLNIANTSLIQARADLTAAKQLKDDLQNALTQVRAQLNTATQEKNSLIQRFNQAVQSLNTANGNIGILRNTVTTLDSNVRRLQNAAEYLPFKDRLGPRVPKYTIQKLDDATSELASIKGAVGVADHAPKATWSEYAKLYNELKTAAEVFKTGCCYALNMLYEMAEKEQPKIRLNKSSTTYKSESAQVVYRFIALDFIKNGHPVANCQAYEQHVLQLNNQGIYMQSSAPEQVLEVQTVNGQRILKVVTHFRYHDDFTPGEEALSSTTASYGIDPLGAKCIWEKLNDQEREHLFNLLMEPAIEDAHPALQKAYDYMQSLPPDRAQLITTLQSLIIDMGVSLEKKYQDLALDEWRATDEEGNYKYINIADPDLQPFTKTKKEFAIHEEKIVEWKLDEISLRGGEDPGNFSFFHLMAAAKDHYQFYFKSIQKGFHQKIYPAYFKANPVTKKHLEDQYYVAHELTSHGCLFSNLLAVLIQDARQISADNIRYLKQAMAAYLDRLRKSAHDVQDLKRQGEQIPAERIAEEANRYERFRIAIQADHNLTIEQYQKWLRKEPGAPVIKDVLLTPTQIDIVAHMLGVRIALFSIPNTPSDPARSTGQIDPHGRLIPVNENMYDDQSETSVNYFGPNTEEIFLMVSENAYTYYGLFPKLVNEYELIRHHQVEPGLARKLTLLNDYWKARWVVASNPDSPSWHDVDSESDDDDSDEENL